MHMNGRRHKGAKPTALGKVHAPRTAMKDLRKHETVFKHLTQEDGNAHLSPEALATYNHAMVVWVQSLGRPTGSPPRHFWCSRNVTTVELDFLRQYTTQGKDTAAPDSVHVLQIDPAHTRHRLVVFHIQFGAVQCHLLFCLNASQHEWILLAQTEHRLAEEKLCPAPLSLAVPLGSSASSPGPPIPAASSARVSSTQTFVRTGIHVEVLPLTEQHEWQRAFESHPLHTVRLQPPPLPTDSVLAQRDEAYKRAQRRLEEKTRPTPPPPPRPMSLASASVDQLLNAAVEHHLQNTPKASIQAKPQQTEFAMMMQMKWQSDPRFGQVLCDGMGVGKTFAAILALRGHPRFHDPTFCALFILPRGLIRRWVEDVSLFSLNANDVAEFQEGTQTSTIPALRRRWQNARVVFVSPRKLQLHYARFLTKHQHDSVHPTMPPIPKALEYEGMYAPVGVQSAGPPTRDAADEEDEEVPSKPSRQQAKPNRTSEEGSSEEEKDEDTDADVMSDDERLQEQSKSLMHIDDDKEAEESKGGKPRKAKLLRNTPKGKRQFLYEGIWNVVVMDEAHLGLAGALRKWSQDQYDLRAKSRYLFHLPRESSIALTGTPLVNSIRDMQSAAFWAAGDKQPMGNPNLWTRVDLWTQRHVEAFRHLFRRSVLQERDLPMGMEMRVVEHPLSDLQFQVEAILWNSYAKEEKTQWGKVFALRRNCLSTALLSAKEREFVRQANPALAAKLAEDTNDNDLIGQVVDMLNQDVDRKTYQTDKILIFSEWNHALKLVQQRWIASRSEADLQAEIGQIPMYTGQTSEAERDRILADMRDRANRSLHHSTLFLNRASGGVGLNLQFASKVYYIGNWFQNAIEDQAIRRVYRPGQLRRVQVIKIVSVGGQNIQEWVENTAREKQVISHVLYQRLEQPFDRARDKSQPALSEEEKAMLIRFMKINPNSGQMAQELQQLKDQAPANPLELLQGMLLVLRRRFVNAYPYWPKTRPPSFYPQLDNPAAW
jgi:hypothetical protein